MRHHIIISGTGRAGTTFLVQLFTELGFDTNVNLLSIFDFCNAGLSWDIRQDNAPYVVKSPLMCDYLGELLDSRDDVIIDYALIPMRDLYSAAESRRRVSQSVSPNDLLVSVPGGLWDVSDPDQQEKILAEKFYNLVSVLTKHSIPMIFMEFPKLVTNYEYLYEKLRPILGEISQEKFLNAFEKTSNPNLVHKFRQG